MSTTKGLPSYQKYILFFAANMYLWATFTPKFVDPKKNAFHRCVTCVCLCVCVYCSVGSVSHVKSYDSDHLALLSRITLRTCL